MLNFIFQDGEIIIKDSNIIKNLTKNSKVLKSMIKDNKLNEEGNLEIPFNLMTKEHFEIFQKFCLYTPKVNSVNVSKHSLKLIYIIEIMNYLEYDNVNIRKVFDNIYSLLNFYGHKNTSLPFKISLPKLCEMLKFYLTCNDLEKDLLIDTNKTIKLIHYKLHCNMIRNSREEYDKEMSKMQDRTIPYINYSKDTLEKNLKELDNILKEVSEPKIVKSQYCNSYLNTVSCSTNTGNTSTVSCSVPGDNSDQKCSCCEI